MDKIIKILRRVTLFIFLFTGILAFYNLSIEQEVAAMVYAKVGGFASLLFSTMAIYEISVAKNMRFSAKLKWIIGIMMFQVLIALWYYLLHKNDLTQQREAH